MTDIKQSSLDPIKIIVWKYLSQNFGDVQDLYVSFQEKMSFTTFLLKFHSRTLQIPPLDEIQKAIVGAQYLVAKILDLPLKTEMSKVGVDTNSKQQMNIVAKLALKVKDSIPNRDWEYICDLAKMGSANKDKNKI